MVPFRNPVIYILYLEASKEPGDCFSYVSRSILYVCFKGQISDMRFHSNSVARTRALGMRKVWFGCTQKKCVRGQ